MIKNGVMIGRTDGMESAVMCLLNRCEQAVYFRQLTELPEQQETVPDLILILQHCPDE